MNELNSKWTKKVGELEKNKHIIHADMIVYAEHPKESMHQFLEFKSYWLKAGYGN